MSSLGPFDEYDEYLRMMAEAQRYKLRVNAHKGFLGDVPANVLLAKLKEEIIELEDAAKRGSKIEMILEAADIANFALGFVIAALRPLEKRQMPHGIMAWKCILCGMKTNDHELMQQNCTNNTPNKLKLCQWMENNDV